MVSVAGSGTGRGSPAVTLVQLPSGQTVQVQGVIQTPHPLVIQSPQIQTVQVATIAETDDSADSEVIDSHKRREILSRRPSYRKILNELSSDVPGIPKIEEEKSEEEGTPPNIATMAVPTSIYQTSTGQYIAIAQGGTIQISNPGSDGVQGLQALTMTNSGAPPPGATIVQYAAQSADGTQQFFVPGSQVVVQAFISTPCPDRHHFLSLYMLFRFILDNTSSRKTSLAFQIWPRQPHSSQCIFLGNRSRALSLRVLPQC
uniref:cAMP-responsive element modulator n=1 Tax=Mus spicilegus TaxID=10103 RepID=A0A8C6HW54_MUSSI